MAKTQRAISGSGGFRDQFELDPELIYLNSGSHSICPTRVTQTVIHWLKKAELNPTDHLVRITERAWKIQCELADFLGASPGDLFFRANVTAAMNAFILGIRLEPGPGEILLSDAEYGACANICRLRAERDGLTLRRFHVPGKADELEGLTEDRLVDAVVRELRPETRLVLLSHVMTGNGLRMPIERIARETRKRGVVLAVDGAHATGALEVDFSKLGDVDFYGGNLHKWVMGPKGTGFGWTHPLRQPAVEIREAGWMTFEIHASHQVFGHGHPYAQKQFQAASIDFAPMLALSEVFSMWREWGADEIRARLASLQECAREEMRKQVGWTCLTPEDSALRGPLLSYELPRKLRDEGYPLMVRILRDHKLQIASSYLQDRWVLRISPHVHNTEDEIARAASILAGL